MSTKRIPTLESDSFASMQAWFAEMEAAGLLFHPDDEPSSMQRIDGGSPMFSALECEALDDVLSRLFTTHGDRVYEACYPIFMSAFGHSADAPSLGV